MKRDQVTRDDFPEAQSGYDRASVDAHLEAVAAWTAALEAQIAALEVERDALRSRLADAGERDATVQVAESPSPETPFPAEPASTEAAAEETDLPDDVEVESAPASGDDEVSARLLATRLVLEGSDREEIVSRLAGAYELDDPEALVDDVVARLA